tara:strand:- start:11213 stop:12103 length:891 start_codon:yes stop_codon:yes gene_type:complete
MNTKSFYYLASYPRSGNTWCRLFIYELIKSKDSNLNTNEESLKDKNFKINEIPFKSQSIISLRKNIDDQLGFDSSDLYIDELDKYRSNIELKKLNEIKTFNLLKVHDAFTSPFTENRPVLPIKDCKGVIYLVRNPIDIVASLSKFYDWDIQETINFLLDNDAGLCKSTKRCSNFVRQYMGTWAFHVKSWTNQNKLPFFVVRYEDLVKSPQKYFSQIAQFLEISSDQTIIDQAIRKTTFEKLKKNQEEYKTFIDKPLTCKEFFWRGLPGEGKKIINKYQRDKIINSLGDIMELYSYV